MLNLVTVFLVSTLQLSAPLILAALGGLASEQAGVINIALEGKMLSAACAGAYVASVTHSPLLGLAGGVGIAVLLSLLHAIFTQLYRIDQVVSGMALNAIALGGTNFVNTKYLAQTADLPHFVRASFQVGGVSIFVSGYAVAAFIAPWLVLAYLRRTKGGLRLLSVGNSPSKARLAGVEPIPLRFKALLATGVLTGLAGVLLVDNAGRFTDNMTSGRGYIALAALIIGGWRPVAAMVACLTFGAFEALQIALQGAKIGGVQLPPQFWQALPYLMAVVALAGFIRRSQAPAGLGQH